MPSFDPRSSALAALRSGASLAALMLVAACGGGGGAPAPAADPAPVSTLSGTVAVGAPIANGTLRILDANGATVVEGLAVDAQGRYAAVQLTGPAPYRLEACGYAGPNYLCVHSVALGAGTANVTPLTSATVLLATGQNPALLMAGSASGLDGATVGAAQAQLRASLAPVLNDAGLGAAFDLVSGALDAGSRTGYDRLLDAVGVATGHDARAFVQITPRLGQGNLYLEQDSSSGSIAVHGAAASMSLAGLDALFQRMSAAMASPAACAHASTGLASALASSARMQLDRHQRLQGAAAVAQGLCRFFAGSDEDPPMWGARLLSPTLGRCDFSASAPLCRVSFVIQHANGAIENVGGGMAVTMEAGGWKFHGDADPIALHASARVQRDRRIDGATPLDRYSRALAFEVPALPGLACAKVSQRNAEGNAVTVGYYKPFASGEPDRLSLWMQDGANNAPSLDPLLGTLRSGDDTWIMLPESAAGDTLVRNFFRGGRTVVFSLYADEACASAFTVDGRSEFEVEVEGVPPVAAALETMPWPQFNAASTLGLRTLSLDAGASAEFQAGWTYARGNLGLHEAVFCVQRGCGSDSGARIGSSRLRPGGLGVDMTLLNGSSAVAADSFKMLSLYGRNGEGMGVQSNFMSCPGTPAGEICR